MRRIDIDEYKKIVLSILVRIDKVCRDYNLTYQLAYGTLLGSVRHGGFIPWDDDADIIMPREDYEKLAEIINNGQYGLNFINAKDNKDTIYAFGKVCDTNTIMYEKNYRQVEGYGAFVDIFPLDYLPDDPQESVKYCQKFRKNILLITHSASTGFQKSKSLKTNILRFLAFYGTRLLSTRKMILDMERKFKKFNEKPTNHLGLPWDNSCASFSISTIYDVTDGTFEGHLFKVPRNADAVLRQSYGDYMQLPPESERVNKHQLECYWIGDENDTWKI